MHSRNPYRENPPNFLTLSELYPDIIGKYVFRNASSGKCYLDWKDPNSQRALTKVLLLHNFRLQVDLPADRLCPPVPNRLNYLCWLSELFEFEVIKDQHQTYEYSPLPILDIGVGASCIYPLLGSRMFGWNFFGSDIDPESLNCANQIIVQNELQSSIKLFSVEPSNLLQTRLWELATKLSKRMHQARELPSLSISTPISPTENMTHEPFSPIENENFKSLLFQIIGDTTNQFSRGPIRQFFLSLGGDYSECVRQCESSFRVNPYEMVDTQILLRACMTNPPFYSRDEQIGANPNTVCLGTLSEMTTEGGEVGFILSIMADSLVLKKRVGWYTSMIGKKSSLRILLRCLRILGVSHVFSTRFIQGKKGKSTVRWGVGWTFLNLQIPASIQYNMSHKVFGLKKLRRKRDVCTNIQLISMENFSQTIDPKEILTLQTFSQHNTGPPDQHHHTVVYTRLVHFLTNMNTIGIKSTTIDQTNNRWISCHCPHCVLSLSFLRVFNSLSQQPSFIFHCVEEISREGESHSDLNIYYQLRLHEHELVAELCVSISAIMKEEEEVSHSKRRRDSSSSEEKPNKKKTRITDEDDGDDDGDDGDGGTRWENLSSGSVSDEEESEQISSVDEWKVNEEPTNEVESVEFSVELTQERAGGDIGVLSHEEEPIEVISPALRKQFFAISEILELDFIRTNRRWRRLLNHQHRPEK